MGKVKKILAGVLVVVIAGSGITAGLMHHITLYSNDFCIG